jgi:enoyl-CoA hydratase/carnithine racemase
MPIQLDIEATVARVTLDAPARLNALDVAMWRALRAAFETLAACDDVHCIVLRGAGGNFAAGADIAEFPRERFDRDSGRRYHLDLIAPALAAIREAPQPVVAAIEGACVGGGFEIASVCDLRIAAAGARLGAPVGKLGFPLALPELAPVLELIGPALAADLLLTGRLLDAREALARGLVQRVADADQFEATLAEVVAAIMAGSPLAARLNKRNLRMLVAQGGSYTAAQLEASFAFFESADYTEGLRAFLERRAPDFRGR